MNEEKIDHRKQNVLLVFILIDILLLILGIVYLLAIKLPYKKAVNNYNQKVEEYLMAYQEYSNTYDLYFEKYTECDMEIKSLAASKNRLEKVIQDNGLMGTDFTAEAESRIAEAQSKIDTFPEITEKISLCDYSIEGLDKAGIISVTESILADTNSLKEEKVSIEMTTKEMVIPDYNDDITFFDGVAESIINPDDATSLLIMISTASDYDPFANLNVSFSGSEPDGKISVAKSNESAIDQAISFVIDKEKGLSNGDIVTISIKGANSKEDKEKINGKLAEKYGQKISVWEKTYEVGGLSYYLNNVEQLDNDTVDKMVSEGKKLLESSLEESLVVSNCEYVGNYLLTPKNAGLLLKNNILYLLYEVTVTFSASDIDYKEDYTYYFCAKYEDILILPDGKCAIDYKSIGREGDTISRKTEIKKNLLSHYKYKVVGYESIDALENDLLFSCIDKYDYQESKEN